MADPFSTPGAAPAKKRRWLRAVLVVLAVVIVVPVAAAGIFLATFDADAYRPRIVAAVKQATGRDLALGALHVRFALVPTVEADDVAFANMPGGSRPQMLQVKRAVVRVALLPLLHRQVVVDSISLDQPDILLETDKDGRGNWQFQPPAPASAQAPGQPAPSAGTAPAQPGAPMAVSVERIAITQGQITWRDGRTNDTRTVQAASLLLTAPGAADPVTLAADLAFAGTNVHVDAQTGALARLQDPAATTPWPVKLDVKAGSASLAIQGSIAQPLTGRGFAGDISAQVPALEQLQPLSPWPGLPPLHDIKLAAHVADAPGGNDPASMARMVTGLVLHVGASDLASIQPGLSVTALDLTAPAADQPVKLALSGAMGGQPLTLSGTTGAPALALQNQPMPVDLSAQAAGGTATVKGQLGVPAPAGRHGIDLAVSLRMPDLSKLSPLALRPLPALKDVAFDGHLAGNAAQGIALTGFKFTSQQGDLSGDLTAIATPRPALRGQVASTRLDIDALRAAASLPPQPSAAAPATPVPPTTATPANKPNRRFLIPDAPLPLDMLRGADADITAKLALVHDAGVDIRNVALHLVLAGGKLALDPFSAQVPGGPMSGRLTVDASQPAPPVALQLRAPGLAVQTVLAALGEPVVATGNVDIDADLRGAGASAHAIAATADGHLGLAMENGVVNNEVLAAAFKDVLQAAKLSGSMPGNSNVRCFAVRADLAHGTATLRTLLLDSSAMHVEGGGTVNMADETLALQLRPLAKIAGAGIAIPVKLGGTILKPRGELDPSSVAGAAKTGFAAIIGALNQNTAGTESCAPALAAARGQAAPPAAAAPAQPAPEQKAPKPADLLRKLFR